MIWQGTGAGATDPRLIALEDTEYVYELWQSIASGTSGTVTPPTGAVILLDRYEGAADALIVSVQAGVPTDDPVVTASGALVTTTFDVGGNYNLSGTPNSYPVALVYQIKIKAKYIHYIPIGSIIAKTNTSDPKILYGTGAPPSPTGIQDGTVYLQYTP